MSFFFFNDTATTEIYTLSLHDALPILVLRRAGVPDPARAPAPARTPAPLPAPAGSGGARHRRAGDASAAVRDRKSTRLNSSHGYISYAVFCLKKKIDYKPGLPHDGRAT